MKFLGTYATQIMAANVFVALMVPDFAHVMKPLLGPSIWALLFVAMVRLDWQSVLDHIRQYGLITAALVWMLIGCPIAIYGMMQVTNLPAGIIAAIVLTAASAPLMSVPVVALMIGLNGSLALVLMVLATFLAPITMPVLALELLGLDLQISTLEMMGRMVGLVGSAFLAAMAFRKLAGTDRIMAWWTGFDGLAVIFMGVFVFAIMDGITAVLLAEPYRVLLIIILSFAINGGLQVAGSLVFTSKPRQERYTLGYVCGMRNMGVILVVLPDGVDPDIVLYFALAQFPIYILPALLKPLYGRLLIDKG
jgi:BASS family bile acid:Na+ symporter